jgi:serine/threonine protein kinase/tetratricopeptide (TPR) repeat protein
MGKECPKCHFENPADSSFCSKCAAPLHPEDDIPTISHTKTLQTPGEELTRGSTFASRYEVIEELGRGVMGNLYRVFDKKINEEVALKLIKPEIAADKVTIERFRKELKSARKISHRNVCKVYDLREEEGTHFVAMEYVPGEDLKSWIRMTRQLSAGQVIFIAKQVCEGLAEAHSLGIVHRDLKSSNIMIDKEGNARIMAFGIARSTKEKEITGKGVMIGTPEYMPPEQVEGKEVDQRSDIYSLGMIMYEMMTGRLPFEGDTSLNIALKHKTEEPPDPREFNAQIPESLSLVMLKCIEKDKEKRYQDTKELLSGLNEIEEGISTEERLIPKGKKVPEEIKSAFRNRWMMIAGIFLVVVLAGIAILFIGKEAPTLSSMKNMLVVLPFKNLGPPEDEYFADGITEEVTTRLAALRGLGIISRRSASQYKNTTKTIKQIGEELGVDYVLEGTVRWDREHESKGRVRVTPQLIRVSDDTHLWSERYDRVIDDIFSVQSEIAEQVIKKLDITVLGPERQAIYDRPTDNIEAYDCYLRGKEHAGLGYMRRDPNEFEEAVGLLEKAVELDSNFTFAFINLSVTHSLIYSMGMDRTEERLAKSRDAAYRALQLEPDLPDAQLALGLYYYRGYQDYERALEIFESVQKTSPNVPSSFLGYFQRRMGNWEQAIAHLEKTFKLNPRSSDLAHGLGRTYAWIGRYEESKEWFDRALSIYPDLYYSKLGKARLPLLSEGNTRESRALLETLPQHPLTDYSWFILGMLERNYQEVLDRLDSSSYDSFDEAHFYIPRELAYASVYHAKQESSLMKKHAESARTILEKLISEHPEDPRFHASLGLAHAYLDLREEAVREGNRAMNLYPVSKDAFGGPRYVMNLAKIFTVVNEYEDAISQLEYLLSIPSGNIITVPIMRIDPQWDPLRRHPRFQRLLREESAEDS